MAVIGRIAYGCDGNVHDSDDILASPLALALLSKNGLAGQLAHYHYNGHFWGDSSLEVVPNQEARMTVSSLATPHFWPGFNMANFFDARAQTATVISHLTGLINASTASDPLWLIAAGPMEIIGRAVNASDPSARQHVYLISHSAGFNDFHAQDAIDTREVGWEQLQGWTYPEVVALGVNGVHIADQNSVLNAPHSEYFWLRDSSDVALRWVWARSQDPAPAEFSSYGPGSGYIWQPVAFDASDAGMIYWLITGGINGGDEAGSPAKLQANLALPTVNFSPFCDLGGDGKSDILWRHDSGQVYFWEMNRLAIRAEGAAAHAPVPNDWHIQAASDFGGDGKSDILWRHDSGQVYFWEMNGLAIRAEGAAAHAPVPNAWHIQGTGDFDGDGKSDILWRHDSGPVYIWAMDGLGTKAEGGVAHAPVPNDWHIQGTGDFDGDGKSDILWRHDSGQIYIWEMNGLQVNTEGTVVHDPVPNDWHIQGIGDFDGDGKSDILWRHDSGQVYTWEMNGFQVKTEGTVVHDPVPNDWHIEEVGDFNGDGKSDILWRHDSGQVYTWEMNGLGIAAEGAVPHAPVPSEWHIFSPYNFV
jgi:FG-GAP-like repeat